MYRTLLLLQSSKGKSWLLRILDPEVYIQGGGCASRTACEVDFAGRVTDVLVSDFLTSMKLFITLSLEIKRKSVNTLCFAMLRCNLILTSVRVQIT